MQAIKFLELQAIERLKVHLTQFFLLLWWNFKNTKKILPNFSVPDTFKGLKN